MHAADDGPGDGRDHDRREGRKRIVPDHDFQGEKHARDGRVEGCGHGRRHAAAQDRAGQLAAEMQAARDPRAERRAQVHDWAFTADRGAAADRGDGDRRRLQARAKRHAAAI